MFQLRQKGCVLFQNLRSRLSVDYIQKELRPGQQLWQLWTTREGSQQRSLLTFEIRKVDLVT